MIRGGSTALPADERTSPSRAGRREGVRYRLAEWLFARPVAASETVRTEVRVQTSAEATWNGLMFYEEVPGRTPFLLRAFLPDAIRTEGEKDCVGARVRCVYRGGILVKRITAVDPPHLLEFEVVEQDLGMEGCMRTVGGSYRISPCGPASEVTLTTNYRAYLYPRGLWRPLEAVLVRQLPGAGCSG